MAVFPCPFSDEFAQTAADEAERLKTRAIEIRARGERWIQRGEDLLREADRLETRVRDLDELLGRSPQLRIDLQTTALQGQQLREAATRILLARKGVRAPIHYREWYELLTLSGFTAGGKEPLATFLTQITRSPLVERVDGETGVYQLDPHAAYERARREITEATRLYTVTFETCAASERPEARQELARAEERLTKARRQLESVLQARSTLVRARFAASASS